MSTQVTWQGGESRGRRLQRLAGEATGGGADSVAAAAVAAVAAVDRDTVTGALTPLASSPSSSLLDALHEDHRNVLAQYKTLLEEVEDEVKLKHQLRLEEELLRQNIEAIRTQQTDHDNTMASLQEVLAHWVLQKEHAQRQVAELCEKESKKREGLEARVKALDEHIEAERRQALEIEEAHKRVAQDIADLDSSVAHEAAVRLKFESKLGQSIDVLKRNAAARHHTAATSSSSSSSPPSTHINASGTGPSPNQPRSLEMEQRCG